MSADHPPAIPDTAKTREQLLLEVADLRVRLTAEKGRTRALSARQRSQASDQGEETESEGLYHTLADNMVQLAWIADGKGRVCWFNQRWLDYTGLRFEQGEGHRWQKAIHPDHAHRVVRRFIGCLKTGKVWEDAFPLRDKGGYHRWFLCQAVPVREKSGPGNRWFATLSDIDAQRQTEKALRDSDTRLVLAQKAGRVGWFDWDMVAENSDWSEQLEALHGLAPQEADNLADWPRWVYPDDLALVQECLRQCFGQKRQEVQLDHRILRTDGELRWLKTSAIVFYEGGQPQRMVGTAVDITAHKQSEQALRQLNESLRRRTAQLQALALELTEAEERERRRIADLLHDDLQQLLVAARFQLSALRPAVQADPPAQSILHQVDQTLGQSIQTSRSLSHELSPAILHLSGLPAAVEWLARQMKSSHGLRIEVQAHEWPGFQNELLRVFLYRAIRELLLNVVKHAETDSALVRLNGYPDRIEVVVSDHGRGVDPAVLDREDSRAKAVGLPGIRERAALLGGSLQIESVRGQGSRFRLSVPLKLDEPKKLSALRSARPAPRKAARVQPPRQARYRVLVADDHPMMREGLISLLNSQSDIQVIGEAVEGREAVEMARSLQPDVVVMDVMMPEMDGIEATRLIKAESPGMRVIGLSMLGGDHYERQMKAAGAEAYLSKAEASEALLEAIRGEGRQP